MDEQPKPAVRENVGSDYWSQSRRPLSSLLFTAPLLVTYEAGLVCLGPRAMHNGAEAWLRQILYLLGFNAYFLLPILTIGILLGWHHVLRQPWRVRYRIFYVMAGECLLLALALWFSWKLLYPLLPAAVPAAHPAAARFLEKIVTYFGAGIYEELLFRLILLNLGIGLLAWMRTGTTAAVVGGMVLTSVLFSAAHYIGPSGEVFRWYTFLFRFLAGTMFAVLFRYRGFGIAAGTHAVYDVLVGLSSMADA